MCKKYARRSTINYLLHNFRLALLLPVVALYLTQRYISGKSKPGWRQRWGHIPSDLYVSGRPRVWVHAVSAGEVVAAIPILRELKAELPDHDIVFSVITPMGYEMAEQQARPYVTSLFYFPIDMPWVVRSVVEAVRPEVFVTLESDMWPNLLHELKRIGAGTVMVNGRISETSFHRTRRYASRLYKWMLSNMDLLLMQSEADAQRIATLAAVPAPIPQNGEERIQIIGNSKFDQVIERLSETKIAKRREELGLPLNAPVLVVGSTRSTEEETEILQAYQSMLREVPDLCLIIAPRHIERATKVAELIRQFGFTPRLKSEGAPVPSEAHKSERVGPDITNFDLESSKSAKSVAEKYKSERRGTHPVLILDTMGELAGVYALATITFVGNSFPPVVNGGGQN